MLFYLASPYTNYEGGFEAAANLAEKIAADFMLKGLNVYSPIAHSHPIAQHLPKNVITDHDFWMKQDDPLMKACDGLLVANVRGWKESKGVQVEIQRFTDQGKPIVFVFPEVS